MAGKRLFLIDAMAMIYRAHFAFARSPLFTSKGENVSAVFGFANTLMALIAREEPDLLAVVYDTSQPTFRHHIYEDYKATRQKMPEELVEQLPRLDELIEVLNIPKLILPGYEADDLVGTVSARAARHGLDVSLVTGDKDYYQLVRDNVIFYDTKKGLDDARKLGPDEVEDVFGVRPDRVIDVLALAGDKSDNIPGVPGVGMKTAVRLIHEYGAVEDVLNHAGEIKGKLGQRLREHREDVLLSKDLVTIRTEAPIDVDPAALSYGPWSGERVRDLFAELEFRTLFRYLDEQPGGTLGEPGEVSYRAVTTENALADLAKKLAAADRFAIDTETTSTSPMRAVLVGISVSVREGEAYYVPVNYFQFAGEPAPPERGRRVDKLPAAASRIIDVLRPVLDGGPGKIAQHAKYDFLVLRRHGVECRPLAFDTMLADYLLNPHQRSHGLDTLALNYLRIRKVETKELLGRGKTQIGMEDVPLKQVTDYACEDADVTLRLARVLEPMIENERLTDLLENVELPLAHVLMKMEQRGIRLDKAFLAEMSARMREQLAELEKECHALAGVEFNVSSPQQLSHVLFEKMHMPLTVTRKRKTGYSTDQAVLEKLVQMELDPLPKKVLEHRELSKLLGTYIDALPELVNRETGRVHTSYHQTVASTGRLSSSDPNLQNIPIRTEIGAEIRRAFVADEGKSLLSADYSQIELRMMAHLSGDEALIEAFRAGEDIHRATAANIFKVEPDEVTKEMRSACKAVNYGVLFGMREFGLSQRMGISVDDARSFIDEYFGAFPRVKRFIDRLLEDARREGRVSTILNRRRPLPELSAQNRNVVQSGERIAIATVVQGSAADLIKLAMLKLDAGIERDRVPYSMLLQVHDELVFEVPRGEEEDASAYIRGRMESAIALAVPIVADAGWGTNWLEAH
ncbi:MAG: DNA polymerase I [Calditrichaeota bacterium]|nr:DNA polymerase I [Calditrichota bacterium]